MVQEIYPRILNRWTLLGLLCFAFLLNYTDRQIVFAIFPVLRQDLHFTDTQLGLAGSLFTWTYAFFMPISGRIADAVPRHRLVILSLALWSLATLGTALSRSVEQFLVWRVVMGIAESLYVPAGIAMITNAHAGGTRSRALAIHGFAQFAGITIGGWYGGWAAEHIGWRHGFEALTGLGLVYAVVLAYQFRGFRSPISESRPNERSSPSALFHSVIYSVLCVVFLTFCSMLWMLYAWLPDFVHEKYHLTLSGSGLTATIYLQSSSALGALLGGYVGDLTSKHHPAGRFRVLVVGLVLCAPFAFLTFYAHAFPLMVGSEIAFGLFGGFFMANIFSSAYDVVSPRNFGFGTGVLNLCGGLGAGAAILLSGVFKQSFGMAQLMFLATLTAITMGIVLHFTVERKLEHDRILNGLGSHRECSRSSLLHIEPDSQL